MKVNLGLFRTNFSLDIISDTRPKLEIISNKFSFFKILNTYFTKKILYVIFIWKLVLTFEGGVKLWEIEAAELIAWYAASQLN